MLFLTPHGINTYVVLLQQLYNWHIDWDFMETSLPWALNHGTMHIRYAVWFVQTHEQVPYYFGVCRKELFHPYRDLQYTPYPVPRGSWQARPGDEFPPVGAFVLGRDYCAVRHMMVLHHGRVPGFDDTVLRHVCTEWLHRVRMAGVDRLVATAWIAVQLMLSRSDGRSEHEDTATEVLRFLIKGLVDDVFLRTYGV
jgi:hypothetical protein